MGIGGYTEKGEVRLVRCFWILRARIWVCMKLFWNKFRL